MRRRSWKTGSALAAALACCAIAAPAAPAARVQQPPAARTATVADLLGTTLDDLLGSSSQQQQLQGLLGSLQSGQPPTGAALAPLQDLLVQLAGTPGLPAESQGLIAQLAALLASSPSGQPLDATVLTPVATLLRNLAGTNGVPADAATLLGKLADVLDGDGDVGGLPLDALDLPPQLIDQLRQLLVALEGGEQPTGTLLAPVGELLQSVADSPELPSAAASLIDQLADSLNGTSGGLDPLLGDQVAWALDSVAATPGLSPSERTTIERISTFVSQSRGGGTGAAARRAATKRDRAVIKRIRVNRARTRVVVRLACPRSAPVACATTVSATLGGRTAARTKRARIGAGRAKVVRLRLVRAARVASVRHGGRLRVRAVTAFGAKRFAAGKAVRLGAR